MSFGSTGQRACPCCVSTRSILTRLVERRADFKRATGALPDEYPDAEEGGSKAFPAIPTKEDEEEEGGKGDAKKDAKKGDADEDEEEQVEDPPDKFVIDLHGASQEFLHVWLPRDEKNNFTQEHDEELLKDELRDGVREKIRLEVCPPARRVLHERTDTEALFRRWTCNWRLS